MKCFINNQLQISTSDMNSNPFLKNHTKTNQINNREIFKEETSKKIFNAYKSNDTDSGIHYDKFIEFLIQFFEAHLIVFPNTKLCTSPQEIANATAETCFHDNGLTRPKDQDQDQLTYDQFTIWYHTDPCPGPYYGPEPEDPSSPYDERLLKQKRMHIK